jgi:ATP/maltotriose-dependent transcriptional regulator MalT
LRQVLEAQRRVVGPKHPRTATTMDSLGFVLVAQQHYVEAEPVLRECFAIRRASMPGDFRQYATQATLGASLAGQGKRAEAESLLIPAYEGMKERQEKTSAPNRSTVISAGEWIIQLYQQSGEAAKAAEWGQRVEQDRRALQAK